MGHNVPPFLGNHTEDGEVLRTVDQGEVLSPCRGHRRCTAGCHRGNGTAFRLLPEADDVVLDLEAECGDQ